MSSDSQPHPTNIWERGLDNLHFNSPHMKWTHQGCRSKQSTCLPQTPFQQSSLPSMRCCGNEQHNTVNTQPCFQGPCHIYSSKCQVNVSCSYTCMVSMS